MYNAAASKKYATSEKGRRARCLYAKRHRKANPELYIWLWAKKRAKLKGLPFSILQSDITIPNFCPVLGLKLSPGNHNRHAASPTLDRIAPALGYVPGNVRVISHRANQLKNDATTYEIERVLRYMRGDL